MDTDLVFDSSQVVVDPVALGIVEPEEEVYEEVEESYDPATDLDYWKARYNEAERKITDQGQQLSQLSDTVSSLLQQQQNLYQPKQETSYNNNASFDWSTFLNGESNNNMDNYNTPDYNYNSSSNQGQKYISVEEAQAIADARIQATLNSMKEEQMKGQALFHKFQTEDTDLAPYAGLVQQMYASMDQRIPIEDRYNHSVQSIRGLIQSGQIPQVQPQRQRMLSPHGAYPVNTQGGQMGMGNPWQQQAPEKKTVLYNDDFKAHELKAWQNERKEALSKKLGSY